MVSFKGKEIKAGDGIRILEDPLPSKNTVRDFKKGPRNERSKLADVELSVESSRMNDREVSRLMPFRKSVPANPIQSKSTRLGGVNSLKGNLHNTENNMEKCDNFVRKVRTGRKAFADLSNVNQNNDKSHQLGKRLGSNQRTMKCKTEGSNILQGKNNIHKDSHGPRVSLTKTVTTASARKSILGNLRHLESTISKCNISDVKRSETAVSKSNISGVRCSKAVIGKSNISGVRRSEATFSKSNISGVRRSEATFSKSYISGVRHSLATNSKSNISVKIGMRRNTLSEATIHGNLKGNRLSYGPKFIKSQGLKIPQSSKLSLARSTNGNASSRKSFRPTSKIKIGPVIKEKFAIGNCDASSLPSNKDLELPSKTEGDHDESVTLQECVTGEAKTDGSHPADDNVKTVISRPKCKRRRSYTSSLVARSEVLGEGTDCMKKDELPNIDDSSNPLEVVEYVDDIYQYYWAMEVQNPSLANYMTVQSEITPRMRGILINWLIEVHFKFELMQETLFLMVELLDRVLSLVVVKKKELQMVGLTSLLLASKYEDFWHPKIAELISISANLYTRDEMLAMEKLILTKLRFRLNIPTPYVFMIRFLKAAQSEKKLEHLAFYLIELCLVEYEALRFKSSLLCASAIYVARCTLNITPVWTGLLMKHARYEEPELRACANMILGFHIAASRKSVNFTYEKFQSPERGCVAKLKPLDKLPL
ncbi:putative cyclin-B3-1 isoform X1 [Dioscorea cayenensis subsp. rotundata]|uniref:Cyclin-B3-1 isoform X1 n=1 Tax=Dioscorea cayennensis subsp. rotundata TaxID=55577 RepID=A0AB40BRT8_DIOCR|nr:putative cyclin-B3-1 isoform X1 [Dioscorea cayenensis subsp. rotundata]